MNTCAVVGSVLQLWRFPVKSMRGEQLQRAEIAPGIDHDPNLSNSMLTMYAHDGSGAVNQERAYVAIASLADAEQSRLAATGTLSRDETQPGRQMTAILKDTRVGDSGDDRRRREWPDPFNGRQSLAPLILGTVCLEFAVNSGDPGIHCPQLFVQDRKGRTSEGREVIGQILDESGKGTP